MDVPRLVTGDRPLEWRPPPGLGWWLWRGLVMLQCPAGHSCHLPHAVDAAGAVTPSAVCPVPGCTFHEFLRLLDWDLGAKPDRTWPEEVLRRRTEELDEPPPAAPVDSPE